MRNLIPRRISRTTKISPSAKDTRLDCNYITSVLRLLAAMLIALLFSPLVYAETRIIKDSGIEIEAFVFGKGSQTLIIASGNGRPAADLEDLAKGIAGAGIRVVTYNYRTIGESKGPISGITLHDYAQDVWRIADALGANKVHLAGKTYGNRVMRAAAADQPDRALSVTLIGAGGEILPPPEVQTKYKRYIDPNTSKEEWLKLQAELMFAPGNEHLASRSAESGKYPELAAAQVEASNSTPGREWAGAGTAPMMILTCLQDLVAVPENGLNLAKQRPDTWLVGIPSCGHNMVFEQPEALRRLIIEYIESVVGVASVSANIRSQAVADNIYTGGPIITVNVAQPEAEAIALKDGKILAVGNLDDVIEFKGDVTKMVDLKGKTLLPGFIDAHGHVFNVGVQAISANLLAPPDGEIADIPSMQRTLRDWVERNPDIIAKTGWIIGMGYDNSQLKEQRHPTRKDLDAISTSTPLMVIHQSAHLAAMNSKGLEIAGYSATSDDPPGGSIRRRAGSKEPDGVLEEMAFFQVVFKVLGTLGKEDNKALLKAGIESYAQFGFTTAQEGRATNEVVTTEAAVANEGGLKMDVVAYPDIQSAAEIVQPPLLSSTYINHFRIGGVKLSLDGSPQGKTAWLSKPYLIPPAGQDKNYAGYPAMTDEQANAYVDEAFKNGWQVLAHCNGDAAADQFIRAVRIATQKYGPGDRRPVMIHAQSVREDQLDAMNTLGIIPSFFGMHTYYWGDWHRDSVLGLERAARISPAASALDRGMIFTQHHDAPVALPSSMMILYSQVNRATRSGKLLGADQRVSPMDAIRSITINAAYQYFEERSKGSLEPGKLADLVILDQNPLTVPPATIKDIKVLETIKQGRTIYKAE